MEKVVVYIAGDPDAYPLEYYDAETQSYRGVIPELLRRFSEQGRYDVRYYASGEGDRRAELAASRQVDLISCPEDPGAVRHRAGEDILLLEDAGGGQAAVLCLLDVAPEGLAGDLRAFLSGIGQQELTGLVLQAARDDPPRDRRLTRAVFVSLALAAALAAALVCVLVSGRRRLKKLRREKDLDPVTGIGNREYLERRCRAFLNDGNRALYTLFYVCFDSACAGATAFSRHMAAVLQNCAGDTDILARVSDNGFALLRLSPGERESEEWISAALYRLRETWREGPVSKIAVGICPLQADDRDQNEILFRGLQTARIAWRKGADYQFFHADILQVIEKERRLREDARSGLPHREFRLYLQFFAHARTGRAAGAKVTLQWQHPDLGPLPASQWLSLLEEEGLSDRLDGYALERMCTFLDRLRQNGREDFFLLYPLSQKALSSRCLWDTWKDILSGHRSTDRQLLLSVPGDAAPGRGAADAGGIDAVRSMGMGLVLDGFDGQIAQLSRAGDARFRGLKLDRALAGQTETASGRAALEAVFQLGHKLDLVFLAEDVDTQDQAARLRQAGCDLLCGALYAPPLPASEAMKKLTGQAEEEGGTKAV